MSETGIICIVFAVVIFLLGCYFITNVMLIMEQINEKNFELKQEIETRASGKYIEYTRIVKSKKKNTQEVKTAITISKILSVFENNDDSSGAFIVTRTSPSFCGTNVYGHATKESYEEIMEKIRAAENPFDYLPLHHPLGGEQFVHFKGEDK